MVCGLKGFTTIQSIQPKRKHSYKHFFGPILLKLCEIVSVCMLSSNQITRRASNMWSTIQESEEKLETDDGAMGQFDVNALIKILYSIDMYIGLCLPIDCVYIW